ncbi:MAG: MFS transporter [Acidobacteriota bacterium]|nr:MFS transporter [Acidobacteriota bacterium]
MFRTYDARAIPFLPLAAGLLPVFADPALLGPFLNPLLADFFGSTRNVVPLGWVGFAATMLSALAMIAAGILSDRGSRLRLCAGGAALAGAASLLSVLVPGGRAGYAVFFGLRALAGIGTGAFVPAAFSLAADTVDPGRRGTAFGLMSVAMLVGRLGGFGLAGALGTRWRTAYVVVGAVELAAAALFVRFREPARGGREEDLREAIQEGARYRFRISKADIAGIRRTRSNVWLVLNFVDAIPGSIVLFLIFKYMKEVHNLNPASVNVMLLLVFAAGAAGAIVFGRIGDWGFRRDKRAKAITALLCNAVPILFMALFLANRARAPETAGLAAALAAPGMIALILTVAAAMFINQGVNPNWYGTLADINLPEHRGTMVSLASVMDLAGNALGPLIAAYAATMWDLRTAMGTVLVFWAVNIVFWIPVLRHVRSDIEKARAVLRARAADMKKESS